MKILPLTLASLVLSVSPVRAQDVAEPLRMAPTSDWELNHTEHSCELRRAFQAGADQASLEFRFYGTSERIEVLVVSGTVARTSRTPRVRFEPDDVWRKPRSPLFVDRENGHGVLYVDNLYPNEIAPNRGARPASSDSERAARELGITALTIRDSFERTLRFETGEMHRPMVDVRICLQELANRWGLDPLVPGPLARGASPTGMAEWVPQVSSIYPADLARSGKGARVTVRLIVGKDGKPTSCLPGGFAEPSHLATACSSMLRYARFNPAVDGNGEPVVGTFETTIVYP